MKVVVEKYGGSSLSSKEKLFSIAHRIVAGHKAGHQMVVVVSAMGTTTDDLLDQARQINKRPDSRELSMLLATGEMVSCSLLAMAIQSLGQPAIALTGAQCGIEAEGAFDNARIVAVDDNCIGKHLEHGRIVVVAGYQGNHNGETMVLGRGGSDATAVALAAALEADECRIFSDVAGVFSADPRIVSDAVLLPAITYSEMVELADSGAQIMMARAVKIAEENDIRIRVQSATAAENGTIIVGENELEQVAVRGIATRTGVALIDISILDTKAKKIYDILKDLSACNIKIMVTSQTAVRRKRFLIQVEREQLTEISSVLLKLKLKKDIENIDIKREVAQISAVGARITESPEIALKILDVLSENQIAVMMFVTSETRITATISNHQLLEAARLLHKNMGFFEAETAKKRHQISSTKFQINNKHKFQIPNSM